MNRLKEFCLTTNHQILQTNCCSLGAVKRKKSPIWNRLLTTGSADQSEPVIEHCYTADNTSHTTDPGNTCCSYTTGTPGTDRCCRTTNSTDKYITAWWSITTFYTPKPGTYGSNLFQIGDFFLLTAPNEQQFVCKIWWLVVRQNSLSLFIISSFPVAITHIQFLNHKMKTEKHQ
jgi:hypothetical protein